MTEMQTLPVSAPNDELEIDLGELFGVLWRGRWWIVLAGILASVIGIVVAFSLENQYRASTVLAPAGEDAKGAGALAGQFGGLASLAGISLPGGGGGTQTSLAVLQSAEFIAQFIQEQGIKPVLYSQQWDAQRQQWKPRGAPGLLKRVTLSWVDDPVQLEQAQRKTAEPGDLVAAELFKKTILSVSEEKKSGLVTVTINWRDPKQAAAWVDGLVRQLNRRMQRESMAEADRSLAYLQAELAKTQEVPVREAIYKLVESKQKSRMVASVSNEVAFKVLDPASAPEMPVSPKRPLIIVLAGMLGGMVAVMALLIRHFRQKAKAGAA